MAFMVVLLVCGKTSVNPAGFDSGLTLGKRGFTDLLAKNHRFHTRTEFVKKVNAEFSNFLLEILVHDPTPFGCFRASD
jgi:hypothetical protein